MGERLSSIWEFDELLSRNVAILVRPDVGLAGGLSGCRKIAAIAEAHHCGVAPHNFLGPGPDRADAAPLRDDPEPRDDGVPALDEDPTTRVGGVRDDASCATAATARCPRRPGSASASSTTTQTSRRSSSGRSPSDGLLRADGSVAAAN